MIELSWVLLSHNGLNAQLKADKNKTTSETLKDLRESQKTASDYDHFGIKCAVRRVKLVSLKKSMRLDE